MISALLKILLSFTVISACFYSIQVFGFNFILLGMIVVALVILASIAIVSLRLIAKIFGIGIGILSSIALALLFLAATTGGSFNLSASNEIIAFSLALTSLLGFSAFLWSAPPD